MSVEAFVMMGNMMIPCFLISSIHFYLIISSHRHTLPCYRRPSLPHLRHPCQVLRPVICLRRALHQRRTVTMCKQSLHQLPKTQEISHTNLRGYPLHRLEVYSWVFQYSQSGFYYWQYNLAYSVNNDKCWSFKVLLLGDAAKRRPVANLLAGRGADRRGKMM